MATIRRVIFTLASLLISTSICFHNTTNGDEKNRIRDIIEVRRGQTHFRVYQDSISCERTENIHTIIFNCGRINIVQDEYLPLFLNGVLHPDIFLNFPSTLNIDGRDIYTVFFDPVSYTKKESSRRHFKMRVFDNHFFEPIVFLIELESPASGRRTSLDIFLKEAHLTLIAPLQL